MSGRTKSERAARLDQLRELAASGYSVQQIAATLQIKVDGVMQLARRYQIIIPASRVMQGVHQVRNADHVMETIAIDAEYLTAECSLIAFEQLDPQRHTDWINQLSRARTSLTRLIRRLQNRSNGHDENDHPVRNGNEDPAGIQSAPGPNEPDARAADRDHPAKIQTSPG